MRDTPVRKEGPRAPLFFGGILMCAVAAAGAQSIDRSLLEGCAALATPEQRLNCFESLLEDPTPPAQSSLPTAPEVAPEPVALEAESAPAPVSAPAADPEPLPVASVPASKPPSPPARQEAPSPAEASTRVAVPPADLGREHIERQPSAAETVAIRATVTEVKRDHYRRLRFHFANGRVWRQMERRTFPYPRGKSFDVEITQGLLGDYQLRVDGNARMTRIVRVE